MSESAEAARPGAVRSRLYDCQVVHVRTHPVRSAFRYRYATFCLDLDEIEALRGPWFGTRWWNVFRFVPEDFLFGVADGGAGSGGADPSPQPATAMKRAVLTYAASKGVTDVARVELVAHMRSFGYAFNPAAFYYCYDHTDRLRGAIVEVTNTYRERKAYWVPCDDTRDEPDDGCARGVQPKEFYVSPFVDLDAQFSFRLARPTGGLRITIDSRKNGQALVRSAVVGRVVAWGSSALLWRAVRFPLMPLQIMAKIHLRALWLFANRVPYLKKAAHAELQKGGLS